MYVSRQCRFLHLSANPASGRHVPRLIACLSTTACPRQAPTPGFPCPPGFRRPRSIQPASQIPNTRNPLVTPDQCDQALQGKQGSPLLLLLSSSSFSISTSPQRWVRHSKELNGTCAIHRNKLDSARPLLLLFARLQLRCPQFKHKPMIRLMYILSYRPSPHWTAPFAVH